MIDDAPKFKVSEVVVVVNAPLFHPNCRCSTVPVVKYPDDKIENNDSDSIQRNSGALWRDYENAAEGKEKERLFMKMNEVADNYYASMRNSNKTDIIKAISKSYADYNAIDTEESKNKVTIAVNHAIYDNFKYYDVFDADYDMMQSFQRLRFKKPLEHNIIMIEYDALENKIMKENPNMIYLEAHELAEKEYNYSQALKQWKEENR